MGYLYIAATVLLTVYGQLVLKWQIGLLPPPSSTGQGKLQFLLSALSNPWVLSGLGSAFAASLCWMLALTRLPLSTAYPFTAMGFVLVLAFSATFLGESVGAWKIAGTGMIVLGIVVLTAKG